MATKQVTMGTYGPFDYDDASYYGLETTGQIKVDTAPSIPNHVVRNTDLSTYLQEITGTFVITGTGFAVNPTGTARYSIAGNQVVLFIPNLTGTSNAVTFTLTGIPAAIQAARVQKGFSVQATDAGALLISPAVLNINAGATAWDLFSDFGETVWTATGTKDLKDCTISYTLL